MPSSTRSLVVIARLLPFAGQLANFCIFMSMILLFSDTWIGTYLVNERCHRRSRDLPTIFLYFSKHRISIFFRISTRVIRFFFPKKFLFFQTKKEIRSPSSVGRIYSSVDYNPFFFSWRKAAVYDAFVPNNSILFFHPGRASRNPLDRVWHESQTSLAFSFSPSQEEKKEESWKHNVASFELRRDFIVEYRIRMA